MKKLEAWVLHKSVLEQDRKFYSLGIFEMTDTHRKAGWSYEQAAENFRICAERNYGRPVILEPVKAAA